MDLSVFKDIKNNLDGKERKEVLTFLKELSNYIEKDDLKVDRNMLEEVQEENKLISKFKDEMLLERIDILNNYAKETSEKGSMYFIYDKNSMDENKYNMCLCNENDIYKVIEIDKNNLPEGAKLNSVLRESNGQYILDKESTNDLSIKIKEMVNKLFDEQEKYLQEYRMEGHIYKVDEKEEDRAWLVDITNNNNMQRSETIEEINIPEDVLNHIKEGSKIKFEDEKYVLVEQ